MEKQETLQSGRLRLRIELCAREVVPDNPGDGTPAMVFKTSNGASSTFYCALDMGELMDRRDEAYPLSKAEADWLAAQEEHVNEFIDYWTKRIKAEGRDCLVDKRPRIGNF